MRSPSHQTKLDERPGLQGWIRTGHIPAHRVVSKMHQLKKASTAVAVAVPFPTGDGKVGLHVVAQ